MAAENKTEKIQTAATGPERAGVTSEETKALIKAALNELSHSYAPYSHFHVAAALLCSDGKVYTGVNIENASYPATNCAERTAFFKAVSEGHREFRAIAICGGADGRVDSYCAPCGICRQVMREFCRPSGFQIILAVSEEDFRVFSLEELLPMSFGPENLLRDSQDEPGDKVW